MLELMAAQIVLTSFFFFAISQPREQSTVTERCQKVLFSWSQVSAMDLIALDPTILLSR